MQAPIDRLLSMMKEAGLAADREHLSYMLGRGAITAGYLAEATDRDEAAELAEEIAEQVGAYWEEGKQKRGARR
jgi:hypothetical protein